MTKLLSFFMALCLFTTNLYAQDFNLKKFKEFTDYKDKILDTKFSSNNKYLAIAIKDNSLELRDAGFNKIWTYKTTCSPNTVNYYW